MSIKTNELQRLEAALGTDSVLLDSASVGTGRLRLDALARYMDGALLKNGTALSTALSNKAEISAQETVEMTTVPSRTVEVAAEDLAAYITAMPRLLTEDLTIVVSGGTIADFIRISSIYGSGSLTIRAKKGEDVIFTEGILAIKCNVLITMDGLKLKSKQKYTVLGGDNSTCIIKNCDIDRVDTTSADTYGITSSSGAQVVALTCNFTHCYDTAIAMEGSILALVNCTCSGNRIGALPLRGGIILLCGTTPDLLGGTANIKSGGIIVKSDGTLL